MEIYYRYMKYDNVHIPIWDKIQINGWNDDCALSHITKTTRTNK